MEHEITGFLAKLKETAEKTVFSVNITEEGRVLSVGDGIVRVAGLRDAKLYELIELESGDRGIVFDLNTDSIGVVLLTGQDGIKAGVRAYKTERIASINAGESLLGRVVDALGTVFDEGPAPEHTLPCPVEREAPTPLQRDFITEPLYTGIKVIDSMLPIGRGQSRTDHRRLFNREDRYCGRRRNQPEKLRRYIHLCRHRAE